jgi:hypothetical protein
MEGESGVVVDEAIDLAPTRRKLKLRRKIGVHYERNSKIEAIF